MNDKVFKVLIVTTAIIFTLFFCIVVIPPFLKTPDVLSALAGGFVNPFSSGYSVDVICCYTILLFWIIHESPKVKGGWICLVLGTIPGVAVGFALYLILRMYQLKGKGN